LAPEVLERLLAKVNPVKNPNVIVGFESADDAGVYRLDEKLAIVQTVDFFTPIVDDPFLYGQIAAANALSDIYAMGGHPIFALSVVGFPEGVVEEQVLGEIVTGGSEKMREAGVPVIGGHSVQDAEMKFGYCVTGKVDPQKVLTNTQAKPGDLLVLTKPIGTGIISTGIKFEKATQAIIHKAVTVMLELNKAIAELLQTVGAHAATDITGFGLIGHAYELAKGSEVTLILEAGRIPVIEGTRQLAGKGCLPAGIMTNEAYVHPTVHWNGLPELEKQIFLDPQTSGGLLISLPEQEAETLEHAASEKGLSVDLIGRVVEQEDYLIRFE
jgi:selenide,water dikinase